MKAFNPFGHSQVQAPVDERDNSQREQPSFNKKDMKEEKTAPKAFSFSKPSFNTSFNAHSSVNKISKVDNNNSLDTSHSNPSKVDAKSADVAKDIASNKMSHDVSDSSSESGEGGFLLSSSLELLSDKEKADVVFEAEEMARKEKLSIAAQQMNIAQATNTIQSVDKENEQKRAAFLALKDKVADIKVTEIAKAIGARSGEDKIRSKWKMPWGDNVSIEGQRWFNHNASNNFRGATGAISFAKYIMCCEYRYNPEDKVESRKAENRGIYWLAQTFGQEIDEDDIKAAREQQDSKINPYSPPVKLDHYQQKIVDYLCITRKLPRWIVDKQIEAGRLYAGIPEQYITRYTTDNFGKRIKSVKDLEQLADNEIYCVFKSGTDKAGASECRCIKDESIGLTKGFSSGSMKKYNGFLVVEEQEMQTKEIALTEAAIDAMSYCALNPGSNAFSTGGTDNFDFIMKITYDVISHPTYSLVYAFDNDEAGENCYNTAISMLTSHLEVELQDKEKAQKAVADLLASGKIKRSKAPDPYKDWNAYLSSVEPSSLVTPERFKHAQLKENATTSLAPDTQSTSTTSTELEKEEISDSMVGGVDTKGASESVQSAQRKNSNEVQQEVKSSEPKAGVKKPFSFSFSKPKDSTSKVVSGVSENFIAKPQDSEKTVLAFKPRFR